MPSALRSGKSSDSELSRFEIDPRLNELSQLSILDQTSDAIIITDLDGKIIFWNKQAEELIKMSRDDALGQSIFDVVIPQIEMDQGMEIVDSFNEQGTWRGEIPFRRKDGREFIASVTSNLLKDKSGEPIGIIGLGRDVTAQKRMEKELADKAKELERSNAELQRFAYVASHDLQEPLRVISSFISMLEERYSDRLDEEGIEFMDYIDQSSHRMKDLIEDLLKYTRVESKGSMFAPVNMSYVVEKVLLSLRKSIEESGTVIDADRLPTIMADEIQMVQLLQNLLSNAIKFRGEEPPRIKVFCSEDEKQWTFSVQDNGIGIDPEFHQRIFQMFQRLHTRDEFEGTGIGLAIAKKIVERHRGRIWVESDGKSGSTFFFTIPKE